MYLFAVYIIVLLAVAIATLAHYRDRINNVYIGVEVDQLVTISDSWNFSQSGGSFTRNFFVEPAIKNDLQIIGVEIPNAYNIIKNNHIYFRNWGVGLQSASGLQGFVYSVNILSNTEWQIDFFKNNPSLKNYFSTSFNSGTNSGTLALSMKYSPLFDNAYTYTFVIDSISCNKSYTFYTNLPEPYP
jgi:hypothetical protein